jgi:hypothetical protein
LKSETRNDAGHRMLKLDRPKSIMAVRRDHENRDRRVLWIIVYALANLL